jgi:hypothetical protein
MQVAPKIRRIVPNRQNTHLNPAEFSEWDFTPSRSLDIGDPLRILDPLQARGSVNDSVCLIVLAAGVMRRGPHTLLKRRNASGVVVLRWRAGADALKRVRQFAIA